MNGKNKHNIILGFATHARWEDTLPFFASLAATSFTGRVGLFCTDQWQVPAGIRLPFSVDIVDLTERMVFQGPMVWRVIFQKLSKTHGIRRWYPRLLRQLYRAPSDRLHAIAEAGDWAFSHPANLRFLAWHSWLESERNIDRVMLSDVRDVIFQDDPFNGIDPNALTVAAEEAHITFGADVTNTTWIKQCYGDAMARELEGQQVFCSGTTFGGLEVMRNYLSQLRPELERHRGPVFGRDQAGHNVLVRRMPEESVRIVRNRHGHVLTMGRMSTYSRDENWTVLNDDGSVPAVVHQYDRHPDLAEAWSKKFNFGTAHKEVAANA